MQYQSRFTSHRSTTTQERQAIFWIKKHLEKFHHQCAYCGSPFTRKNPATADHIRVACANGTSEKENTILVHAPCNVERAHLPIIERLQGIPITSLFYRPDTKELTVRWPENIARQTLQPQANMRLKESLAQYIERAVSRNVRVRQSRHEPDRAWWAEAFDNFLHPIWMPRYTGSLTMTVSPPLPYSHDYLDLYRQRLRQFIPLLVQGNPTFIFSTRFNRFIQDEFSHKPTKQALLLQVLEEATPNRKRIGSHFQESSSSSLLSATG